MTQAEFRQGIYRAIADSNKACQGESLPCTESADKCDCWRQAEAVIEFINPLIHLAEKKG